MASANHYEVGYSDSTAGFSWGFIDAIDNGRLTTTEAVFQYAKTHTNINTVFGGNYANNAGTWANRVQHPWGIGENFSIFVSGSTDSYTSDSYHPDNWSDNLIISNSSTGVTDTLELLAGNKVYINYAYSNPQNAAVNATVTIYGRNATPETLVISDAGTGSLATNFNLGTFDGICLF
jgi:hypothetical protein